MSLKIKIIVGLVSFLVLVGLSSIVYNWYSDRFTPPVSQNGYIETTTPKKARNIKKEQIQAKVPIVVLNKDESVKELKIGEPLRSDQHKFILKTGEVSPYEGKTNILAVWDNQSGETAIQSEQQPLSFLGFENKKEAYIEGGYNTKGNVEIGLGAQWQFARVANARIGVVGEVRGSQDDTIGFAGLRITYTFK
jgi:hypothetical protein